MANLRDLAARLMKQDQALSQKASDLAVKVATAIITDLANETPVDTSKALSNWLISLDTPTSLEITAHSAGRKGSTQEASVQQTIADAVSVLKTKKPGQIIIITNNLPYIRVLNDGSSSQQPAGFVERAQLIGRVIMKQGL